MNRQACLLRSTHALLAACAWLAGLLVAMPLGAATRVPLTVAERDGVARRDEPVTFGVPIPRGELVGTDNVRLLLDGEEVAAQFRAAGLWRPGESIRWLLVDCQASTGAGQQREYVLEYGRGVSRSAKPAAKVQVEEDAGTFTVKTGAVTFRISKTRFSLFDEVRIGDARAIVPLPGTGAPRVGARVAKVGRTVTRAIPAASNRGRSHLIYVRCSDRANSDDYTLRFTSDRQYELAGAASGPGGKGAYREDFTSTGGAVSIPRDAWLAYHFPKQGDVYTFRTIAAAARHTADIDVHHQPHYPGLHFVKGGFWAHSTHAEPGHKNPHRNYNHFTKDLAFGARGTATYYYLTGDWKAHDACLEIAQNALAEYMSPQKEPDPRRCNRMGWRGDACTLNRLLEGYLLSGDEKYLRRARWQVASCAFDGHPPKHRPVSLWSSVFYMMALARYVEMFPDDAAARSYLVAHLQVLSKATDPDHGIYYTITPRPDGSVVGKGTCSHYNIMAADALAIGHLLTGEREYLETARRCFDYGVKNACWEGGPATYTQVHSANGAMHGNVFMAVDASVPEKAPEQ